MEAARPPAVGAAALEDHRVPICPRRCARDLLVSTEMRVIPASARATHSTTLRSACQRAQPSIRVQRIRRCDRASPRYGRARWDRGSASAQSQRGAMPAGLI